MSFASDFGLPFGAKGRSGGASSGAEIGDVIYRPISPGSNFLPCDGSLVSVSSYPDLAKRRRLFGPTGPWTSRLTTGNVGNGSPITIWQIFKRPNGGWLAAGGGNSGAWTFRFLATATDPTGPWTIIQNGQSSSGRTIGTISEDPASGRLVCIGRDNGGSYFEYSTTGGASWSTAPTPPNMTTNNANFDMSGGSGMPSIIYGNGRFSYISAAASIHYASTDGANWTQANQSFSAYPGHCEFFDGYFWTWNSSQGMMNRSADGLTWVASTQPSFSQIANMSPYGGYPTDMAVLNGRLVLIVPVYDTASSQLVNNYLCFLDSANGTWKVRPAPGKESSYYNLARGMPIAYPPGSGYSGPRIAFPDDAASATVYLANGAALPAAMTNLGIFSKRHVMLDEARGVAISLSDPSGGISTSPIGLMLPSLPANQNSDGDYLYPFIKAA